jgi:integrase
MVAPKMVDHAAIERSRIATRPRSRPADVQEWIAGLTLKPASIRRYLATLRAVLDFAGVDPNPARDNRVRLPREQHVPVDPPSAQDVEAIIATIPQRWRLPLRTLEQTGMRVGELHALAWATSTRSARDSGSSRGRRARPGAGSRCPTG